VDNILQSFQLAIIAPRLDLTGYGTTTAQGCSTYVRLFMANIGQVGALITVKDKFNTQHFSHLMITSSDSSPKQNIVEVD